MIVGMTGVQSFMLHNIYSRSPEMGGAPPTAFFVAMFAVIGIFSVVMTIPSVVAGYALLSRRSWAKVAGIVGGVVAATSFPIGTAVAVYTFWFLFGEPGKQVYPARPKHLPPSPPEQWPVSGGYAKHDDGPVSYSQPSPER